MKKILYYTSLVIALLLHYTIIFPLIVMMFSDNYPMVIINWIEDIFNNGETNREGGTSERIKP